jgi:hypothetical protein
MDVSCEKMKFQLLIFGLVVGLGLGQEIGWWKNTIVYQVAIHECKNFSLLC